MVIADVGREGEFGFERRKFGTSIPATKYLISIPSSWAHPVEHARESITHGLVLP